MFATLNSVILCFKRKFKSKTAVQFSGNYVNRVKKYVNLYLRVEVNGQNTINCYFRQYSYTVIQAKSILINHKEKGYTIMNTVVLCYLTKVKNKKETRP